jgi:hypothetical protein
MTNSVCPHKLTKRGVLSAALLLATAFAFSAFPDSSENKDLEVRVVPKESERRVDVMIGGQLFTAYVFPDVLKKPVLYPLRTARGTTVTRGYPLEPRPGERIDHPHQVGLWFNYGDVNGLDFWNNSDAIPPANRDKMGTIVHRRVKSARGGQGRGELEVVTEWLAPDGKTLLREETRFVFQAAKGLRGVDRITHLTALNQPVNFTDNKEGVLGMRVAREIEHPATQPEVFTDSSGKATPVPVLNNEGVTGKYHSSEGKTGDEVWGTRGRWTALSGKIGPEDVTVAILDHTGNPGFPTYWHARGYGLFAANPLGQKAMSDGKQELNFKLAPRESALFRYRILILSEPFSAPAIEKEYQRFQTEVK